METINQLKKILEAHELWVTGDKEGVRADLSNKNLSQANLSHATLFDADLFDADLSGANLSKADLSKANLYKANLSGANLSSADLLNANLTRVNFTEANLSGANLKKANYSIINILRANWNNISDKLTLELMRWDAISCGAEAMNKWAKGGKCPFSDIERDFYFSEQHRLWRPGKPKMNHKQLFQALAKESEITI